MMFTNEQKMYIVLNMISDIKDSVSGKEDAKIDYQIASRIYNNAFSSMVLHGYDPVMKVKDEVPVLTLELEGKTYECPARTVKNNLKNEFTKIEEKIEGLKEAIQEEDKKIAAQDREYKKKKNAKQDPAQNEKIQEPVIAAPISNATTTEVQPETNTEKTTTDLEPIKEELQENVKETEVVNVEEQENADDETSQGVIEQTMETSDAAIENLEEKEKVQKIDIPEDDVASELEEEAVESIPVIEEENTDDGLEKDVLMEDDPQDTAEIEEQESQECIPEVEEYSEKETIPDAHETFVDATESMDEIFENDENADPNTSTIEVADVNTSEHKFQKKEQPAVIEVEEENVMESEPEPPVRQTKQEKGGFFSRFLPKSKNVEIKRAEELVETVTESVIETPVEIPTKEDEVPADMICHTHYVTLKKTYGTQALGPYIIQIWPTEVVELNEDKVQSNIFVRAQSPNGTVIYKTNEGKAKYIILTIDDKQFNVFGYWENGEFLTDVATINKTASIYTKMEQVDKKSPENPTDEFLDQFRLREARRPEFFVVPLDNVNHGEENIPIAAYARSNEKNYVINKKGKGNSLRFSYAGETCEISGRWENGKFVFVMNPVNE